MASLRNQPELPPELPHPHDTPWQVVRRLSLAPRAPRSRALSALIARFLFPTSRRPGWQGYVAAVLGVALVSCCIALIQHVVHIANISLLYLLVVLWIATAFGWGPAFLASVLAFLAFDFFFVPPFYRLTVDDPTEWVSLLAFLITALVLGQLTALVQARAHEASESQQRTAILYALAQLIASTTDQRALLEALARRVLEVFTPAGVRACALFLPDANKRPIMRAVADGALASTVFKLEQREQAALAGWVLTHGSPVGSTLPRSQGNHLEEATLTYVPLQSGQQVAGVLGMVGTPETRRLVSKLARDPDTTTRRPTQSGRGPETELFEAFCDQIALALERAVLQQQAIRAEALRESNHLKDVLLGSVSHELRTPLASIQAAASSLLEADVQWSEAEQRELLESITTSAGRLNRLVSNLLDLSRLEAGVSVPQKDWHFIGEVVEAVLDRLDLAGLGHDHQVQVELPDVLPLVPMDHEQIEQVLTNLVENAMKYSPVGSTVRIQAQVKRAPEAGEELEVRVSDQGIGIPAGELEAIFDKFYRVQQVRLPWAKTRPPTGTGLGLAICANIIRAHGGRIWAESQPSQGSTFIFTLPLPAGGPETGIPTLEGPPSPQATLPTEVPPDEH